jgi:hypothetical protein
VIADQRVRPVCQPVPLLKGEVEQRCKHRHREFGGNGSGPVEGLVAGQPGQQTACALPDQDFITGKIGRGRNGGNRLSFARVPRWVAGNETSAKAVVNTYASPLRRGGEARIVQFNRLNVIEARDRSIGAVRAEGAMMNGLFASQSCEVGTPLVLLE